MIDFPPAAATALSREGNVQNLSRISVEQELPFSVLLWAQCAIFTAELARQTTQTKNGPLQYHQRFVLFVFRERKTIMRALLTSV